jgi:hypothetical protein
MNRDFNVIALDDFPRIALNVATTMYKTMDIIKFSKYFNFNVYPCYTYEQAIYLLAKLPKIDLFITDYIILPKPMILDRLKREANSLQSILDQNNTVGVSNKKLKLKLVRLKQIPEDMKILETKPLDIPNADDLAELMQTTQLEEEIMHSAKSVGILTTKLLINYALSKSIPIVVLSGDSFEEKMIRDELQIEIMKEKIGISRFIFTNKLELSIDPSGLEDKFEEILLKAIEKRLFDEMGLKYSNPHENIVESQGLARYIHQVKVFNDNLENHGEDRESSNDA